MPSCRGWRRFWRSMLEQAAGIKQMGAPVRGIEASGYVVTGVDFDWLADAVRCVLQLHGQVVDIQFLV